MSSFESLPPETLLHIVKGMSIADIWNLSQACPIFRELSRKMREVWLHACDVHTLDLPAGTNINTIAASLLPQYAARAIKLFTIWKSEASASPKRWRTILIPNLITEEQMNSPAEYNRLFGLYRDHDPIAFLHVIPGSNWTIAGLLGEICLFNPDNTELTHPEAFLPIGIKGNYICTSYPSKSPGVVMLALMASGSRWSSFSKTHYGHILEVQLPSQASGERFPDVKIVQSFELPSEVFSVAMRDPFVVCTHDKERSLFIIDWKRIKGIVYNCYDRRRPFSLATPHFKHVHIHPYLPIVFYARSLDQPGPLEATAIPEDLSDCDQEWMEEDLEAIATFPDIHHPIYLDSASIAPAKSQDLNILSMGSDLYSRRVPFNSQCIQIEDNLDCTQLSTKADGFFELKRRYYNSLEFNNGRATFGALDSSHFVHFWFERVEERSTLQVIMANYPPEISALRPRDIIFSPISGKLYGKCKDGLFAVQY
ncbi:hypothetical protein SISSUDRAFT_1062470 [Sistotremastrum suecicum HHB10207 ss-3]|uniref:F-box domain-containing protein n=1 Tax=Sistotremastrum suecicum HHB10207 ss-3 TaxID=1314776 RepID=A0A166CWL9_9AGAM|nr:hypothetical protein SISSUDRAFT_1062470 [Sistotremastrum suecicum HHB10207 ss-3]